MTDIVDGYDVAVKNEEALVVDMLVNFYRYDHRTIDTFKEHLYGWDDRARWCLLSVHRYLSTCIKSKLAFKNVIYVENIMVIKSYVKTCAWVSITVGGGLIKHEPKAEVVPRQ